MIREGVNNVGVPPPDYGFRSLRPVTAVGRVKRHEKHTSLGSPQQVSRTQSHGGAHAVTNQHNIRSRIPAAVITNMSGKSNGPLL